MNTFKVVFTPSGIRGEVPQGTDILSAARDLGADLASLCGGNGQCTRCKIKLSTGSFPKHQITSETKNLSPITSAEKQRLSSTELNEGYRLGCNAKIQGNLIIDVPIESQTHQQVIRKAATALDIQAQPAVSLIEVEVEEPQLHIPSGDLERLKEALEFEAGLKGLSIDPAILRQLQPALRKGKWQVTVAVYEGNRIIGIWPNKISHAYGLAVDIGSTTIAGHLCELDTGKVLASQGIMNPQIRFGEDLMSRVSYSMMNPGGDLKMTEAVRDGINHLIDQLLLEANQESDSDINKSLLLDATFVGNPVMHHLFLGLDPVELGGAPFALATQTSITLSANDVALNMASGAQVYLPPCIAGHVGADAAAVVLSEAPYRSEAMTLIIDVGTNAEIVLGNRNKLVAASSPTGPAFEGAQIHHGQRAAPGAIERVRIDPNTLEPRYKVIGIDLWSDESGFNEAIQETGITGICGSGIIEAIATLFLARVIRKDGIINGEKAQISSRLIRDGKTWAYQLVDKEMDKQADVLITQNDVRAIQLAKGTLYASVQLLMDKLKITQIDNIHFAGAFGTHIDPKYATVLGMIPDCPLGNIKSVGNAAGTGARIALTSIAGRREIENEVLKMEKIETATEVKFQEYFINAMAIPHNIDSFPNISQVVDIPDSNKVEDSIAPDKKRRRRRR